MPKQYVVIILSSSSSTEPDYVPLYEEAFWLMEAESREQAVERAIARTEGEKVAYQSANGHHLTWTSTLVDVGEALPYHEDSSHEAYSRFFRNIDAYNSLEFEDFRSE